MKTIIGLLLVLFTSLAHGQAASAPAQPPCLPGNVLLKGTGTDYNVFETAFVHGEVGWCPSPDGATWFIYTHRWCMKAMCDKAPPDAWSRFMSAVERVRAASEPASQVRAEWATHGIPLATDLEKWQWRDWRYQMCQWMTSTQPGITPRPPLPIPLPKKLPTDIEAPLPPMDYCDVWKPGLPPGPPAPLPDVWLVTASATPRPAYPWIGTPPARSLISDNTVKLNSTCDCTAVKKIDYPGTAFAVTYCAVASSALTTPSTVQHVTACSLKK